MKKVFLTIVLMLTVLASMPQAVTKVTYSVTGNKVKVKIIPQNVGNILALSLKYSTLSHVLLSLDTAYVKFTAGTFLYNYSNGSTTLSWFSPAPQMADTITLIYTGNGIGTTSLLWDMSWPSNNEYIGTNYQVTPSAFQNTVISCAPVGKLYGSVFYSNDSLTPMAGVIINLYGAFSQLNYTTITLADGSYSIDIPRDAWYVDMDFPIDTSAEKGINSTDALCGVLHFTAVKALDSLSMRAADVNNDGFINATDGLIMTQLFVNGWNKSTVPSYVPGYVFEPDDQIAVNGNTKKDFYSRVSGDVNGSYVPPK